MKKNALALIFIVMAALLSACSQFTSSDTDIHQGGTSFFRPSSHIGRENPGPVSPTGSPSQRGIDLHEALRSFADATLSDYYVLAGNEELTTLAQQWARLQLFMEESAIRTTRRGILMDSVISMIGPPFHDLSDIIFDCDTLLDLGLSFVVGVTCQNHVHNELLLNTLLEFTEICRDNLRFEVMGEMVFGMMPTRQSLTTSQQYFLNCLESFMAVVNAPFWEDMYSNDPIITHIGLPTTLVGWGYPFFTVWLYDPDLLGLPVEELEGYTSDMRAQILDFITVDPYHFEFRVNAYGQ